MYSMKARNGLLSCFLNAYPSMTRFILPLLFATLMIAPVVQAQTNETFKFTAGTDAATEDFFGFSVALTGEHALVGAPFDDDGISSNEGSAYVFERQSDGTWNQVAKLTATDAAAEDEFGRSVALSGDRALIGAPSHDAGSSNTGAAYVFDRQSDGTWSQVAKLTTTDAASGDFFGFSVALTGNRALVSAFRDDDGATDAGSAYVFDRQSDGTWSQVAKLTADDAAAQDRFGQSVALTGYHALVSAFRNDEGGINAGAAYVFERRSDGWSQVAKLTAADAAARDFFGVSVALAGTRALVGSYLDDYGSGTNTGSAYVFERQAGGTWSQVAKLTAADAATGDQFGQSVALSGDRILVSASDDDDGGSDAGSAYVFERQSDGTWSQVAKLAASDAAADDRFGLSVALSGGRALVSSDRDDDGGIDSGSAYVFDNVGSAATVCDAPFIADKRAFAAATPPYLEIDLDATAGATLTSVRFVVDPAYFADPASFEFSASEPADRTARFLEGLTANSISGGLAATTGDYIWEATGTPTRTATFKLESDDSDSFAYYVEITNSCGQTAYVDPVNSFESFSPVATERGGELPAQVMLDGNYPNPFNPQTVIRYGLPEASEVRLAVYDAMGRQVRLLVSQVQGAGWHTATFEAAGLPSGVYLYRLEADAASHTGRMLLVK